MDVTSFLEYKQKYTSSINRQITIQFVSDIHLEYRNTPNWWEDVITPKAPYLILAGDIAPATHPFLPEFYKWCSLNFKKTIHIPGNHEYWRYGKNKLTMKDSENYIKNLCSRYNIIYCQKDIIELEPSPEIPKIVGCTLWADVPINFGYSADFSAIKDFTPQEEKNLFNEHRNFIENAINILKVPPIVVTHHAPIEKGTQRKENENNHRKVYYVNNLDYLVDKSLAWIFGHTHHVCDIYLPSGAIVTSNPIGSPEESLPSHKVALLVVNY